MNSLEISIESPCERRLIVVLGMHRSGTSAITRGLEVLGVKLGEHLIPGLEGNNRKGFYEDWDIVSLNDDMLKACNRSWRSIESITEDEVDRLCDQGYLARAVELLRGKISDNGRFGFKDPRTAKLLAFWSRAFVSGQFDVGYVLAIRNPLSVARSLAQRDGFDAEHSYLLWADHVVSSLSYAKGKPLILVDYDHLIHDSCGELARIGNWLGADIDQDALTRYGQDFLEAGLRHSWFLPDEVYGDAAVPDLIKEIYASLVDVHSEKLALEELLESDRIKNWKGELNRLRPVLRWAERQYDQKLLDHRQIASLNEAFNQAVTEHDAKLAELNQGIAERDAQIDGLRQDIMERNDRIAVLNQGTFERDAQIAVLNQAMVDRESRISAVQNRLFEQEQTIAAIRTSSSWRITAPLRWTAVSIKRVLNSLPLAAVAAPQPALALSSSLSPRMALRDADERKPHDSPSLEALSGLHPATGTMESRDDANRLIAFYLPQYHRVPENSEWWGPGFTEWTNVVRGRPNFVGHYQPHLPRELGFYDLSSIEVMREQVELARLYGISAFCFYHYWFSGRRVLERPVENFLRSDIDFPYCLCWANENWTRTWDGDTRSVLMEQKYLDRDPYAFITSLLPHFRDRRYLRVNGKPMLLVYRAKDIPDTRKVFDIWREIIAVEGFPGLHIVAVDFYDISRPDDVGADALVEFPPHKFNGPQSVPDRLPTIINPEFKGGMVDYAKMMAQSANRQSPDFTLYRGILPSWDNTARRQNTPTIVHGSHPDLFGAWLRYLRAYTREAFAQRPDPFIFVNAWNEWGEGCHLEPDQKWGLGYLDAVKLSSRYEPATDTAELTRARLLSAAAASIAQRDTSVLTPSVPVEQVREDLQSTRQLGSVVQKTAYLLRHHPRAHRLGKSVYQYYLSMRGYGK